MYRKLAVAAGLAASLAAGQAVAQVGNLSCADIHWSAQVLENNPDIGDACRGVYEKNGKLYARTTVEVVRVRGNTITFRPLHTDGSKGDSRSITVPGEWRARIAGRDYRAGDLMRGQELNVYIPEDRFALAVHDDEEAGGLDEAALIPIEDETVEMPMTSSPLFLIGLAGGGLLALGGVLGVVRRRR
jgi:hypothetical protein